MKIKLIILLVLLVSCNNLNHEEQVFFNSGILSEGRIEVTRDNVRSCIYENFVLIGNHKGMLYINFYDSTVYFDIYGAKNGLNKKIRNRINSLYRKRKHETAYINYFKVTDTTVFIDYYKVHKAKNETIEIDFEYLP